MGSRPNLKDIWCLIVFSLSILVLAPLVLWGAIKFHQRRSHLALSKRHPRAVIIFNLVTFLALITVWPFWLWSILPIWFLDQGTGKILGTMIAVISPFLVYGVVFIQLFRFYFTWFEFNWNWESMNVHWKILINPFIYVQKKKRERNNQTHSNHASGISGAQESGAQGGGNASPRVSSSNVSANTGDDMMNHAKQKSADVNGDQDDGYLSKTWFLTHRYRYGNAQVIIRLMSIPYLILATISACLWVIEHLKHRIAFSFWDSRIPIFFDAVAFAFPLFLMIFFWHKTPPFHDMVKLRHEFSLYFKFSLILVVSLFVSPLMYQVTGNDFYTNLLVNLIMMMGASCQCFLSTWWLLYKLDHTSFGKRFTQIPGRGAPQYEVKTEKRHVHTASSLSPMRNDPGVISGGTPTEENEHKRQISSSQNGTLFDFYSVLADPHGFELFFHHCAKEFSMENLLAIVEMHQFKRLLEEDAFFMYAVRSDSTPPIFDLGASKRILDDLQLPGNIPKSFIVYGDIEGFEDMAEELKNHEHFQSISYQLPRIGSLHDVETSGLTFTQKYKLVAFKLVHKYVAPGSELEVNLSFQTRRRVMKQIYTASSLRNKRSNYYKDSFLNHSTLSPSSHKKGGNGNHHGSTGFSLKRGLTGSGHSRDNHRHNSHTIEAAQAKLMAWILSSNLTNKDLYHCLDESIVSLCNLLRDSYTRFMQTNEFQRFVKEMGP